MLSMDADTRRALDDSIAFAIESGQLVNLTSKLQHLGKYGGGADKSKCVLTRDTAPHSYLFELYLRDGDRWTFALNGALLYHGPHDGFGSGEAPTFAVTVEPTTGWSIHT